MTAIAALMPTHVQILAALSTPNEGDAAPKSSNLEAAESDPIILKYIIVQTPRGVEVPIIFPQSGSLSHADLVPAGCTPVSAGFCLFYHDQVTIPDNIPSSTLNLYPRPSDKSAIARLLNQ